VALSIGWIYFNYPTIRAITLDRLVIMKEPAASIR